jgi:hypothetical protein
MQRTRTSFLTPMSALASVAVLIAAGTIGVFIVRADDRPDDRREGAGLAPQASASPSASASTIDACLLGSWTVKRATSNEIVDDDLVEFVSEDPVAWRLNPDGTGEFDLGGGTTYAAGQGADRITFVYKGKVTFSFTTESRRLKLTNFRTNHNGSVLSIRGKSVWIPVDLDPPSLAYACDGTSLSLVNEVESIDLRRV